MRKKTVIPPNNIEKLRMARGWPMEKLGEMIGVDGSTINKLEKRKTNLSPQRLLLLSDALGVSPNDILMTDGGPSASLPPREDLMPIPIMGVAAGSLLKGSAQLTTGPVDMMPRPRALEHAADIYAVYVDGTSMEPMFRHGQPIIISPHKPARSGDVVLVQEQHDHEGPILASVGILKGRNEKEVVLSKLNPVGTLHLKAEYVVEVHKVLDYSDLIGLL